MQGVDVHHPYFETPSLLSGSKDMIYRPKYSVADYETWSGDWELWQGVAVSMTPSPFGNHQFVLVNIVSELRTALRKSTWRVLAEIDWRVDELTVVRPDVVVLDGQVPVRHVESTPRLIVEILSESTAAKDRTAKRELYEQQRVPNYLIVDAEQKRVEFFVLNGDAYQAIDCSNGRWTFDGPERPIELDISEFF